MTPVPEAVTPLVTVLLISFQSIEPLKRAVTALEASDIRDRMEILVVDGGSTDGSQQLDAEFPGATVMRLPRYFGATKLRNIGVRTAKGEYVLFLSPGVEVQRDTVRLLADAMEARTELGGVCPLLIDEAGQPARQLLPLPSPNNISQAANGNLAEMPVPAGDGDAHVDNPGFKAFLTRRQTIAGMNYLDERYGEFWSDADLCFKLRKAGKKLAVIRNARAVENTAGLWRPNPSVATAFAADRANGAAQFAGKHFGGIMGAQLKLKTMLGALAGMQFGVLTRMIGGQKVDGTEVIS